jgi:hypothetical protein
VVVVVALVTVIGDEVVEGGRSGAVSFVGGAVVDGTDVGEAVGVEAQPVARPQAMATLHQTPPVRRPGPSDLPLRSMKRLGCVAIGIAVLAAGCNVDQSSSTPDTLAPLGTPSNTVPPTLPVTTVPASTVAGVAVVPASTMVLPSGACVFSPPPPSAEVTFEVGTRLYTVNPANGTTSCLTELTVDDAGPLRWSPAGDRVLLNSVTVFDGSKALTSGYLSTNNRVSWSYPTGKALIAPAVADNHLLWRTAGQPQTRTDISFLARTDVAVYHPAGRDIFAAGLAADGTEGLFVASNRGQNSRLLARLDEPNTAITEIGADPSGSRVYFIHDHKNGTFHVHAIDLPDLTITDVLQVAEPVAKLTVNFVAGAALAVRVGDCSGLTRTQVFNGATAVEQPAAFAALSTEPIGWLDTQQIVLSARATGCSGPSDLWIWNIATSAATPLVGNVDAVAVRSVLTSFGELPGDINSAAPG